MIAFSQTTELAQLATINVAAPKTAEPSDGSGAAFLQTIYELSTAAIPSQPTNVAPPEERGLVGQTLAIDETKTSLEDCQPDPQSVLGYVQLPFVLPSPTTAPFTFSMVQPQQYGPEDTKLLLDQNAVVPTSNTQKAGSADISDEAFDLPETGMASQTEIPTDAQTADTVAAPIPKNVTGKAMIGFADMVAAEAASGQPSAPRVVTNGPAADELGSVAVPHHDGAFQQLASDRELSGADLKNEQTNHVESQKYAQQQPITTVGTVGEVGKFEPKEQHHSAAEIIWRQKWMNNESNIATKALPADPVPDAALATPSQLSMPVLVANNTASPLLAKPSNGATNPPQNDRTKQLAYPSTIIPAGSFPTVAVTPISADISDQGRAGSMLTIDRDAADQTSLIFSTRSAIPMIAAPLSHSTLVANTQSLLTNLPTQFSPTVVNMLQTKNDGPLEMALAPEELGKLTISIKQDGDYVQVTVIADRPETVELMRRHSADLVTDLRQSGYSGATISFGQGNQGQHSRSAASDQNRTHPQTEPQLSLTDQLPSLPARAQKGSGIDIRL